MNLIENISNKITKDVNDFSSIWNIIDIVDGVIISHSPFAITGIAYFPQCFMKPDSHLQHDMEQLIRSFTRSSTILSV